MYEDFWHTNRASGNEQNKIEYSLLLKITLIQVRLKAMYSIQMIYTHRQLTYVRLI